MRKSYRENRSIIGLDKMLEDVRETFPGCRRNRVYRLQRKHRLYVRRKRKRKILTTDSKNALPVAENLLHRSLMRPRRTGVGNRYHPVLREEGGAYLAIVKDLYTKEIVGWALEDHMMTSLCLKAPEKAYKKQRPGKCLIHHSDRGPQYCSREYQRKLRKYRVVPSMSRKGNCWDNAPAK